MEKREEEWNEMKQNYQKHEMSAEQFEQMKAKIEQAKKENRTRRNHRALRNIVASAAAVAVVFTILPNTSPTIAYAMSQVPGLSKLVDVDKTEDDAVAAQTKKSTDEINAEIQTITDELIQEFENEKKNEDGYQDMTVKSEVLATTEQYFTLKLMCYQSDGSGVEWDYYYTIDLTTGERLKLADLFTDGSDYLTVISDSIKQQMKVQMAADENVVYWLNSDVPECDFQSITDDTSFYLNENGELVISFNEGDVAPMYMGCVTFTIPNDVLTDIRK